MNNFTRFVACAFAGVFMAGSLSAQTFNLDKDTVKAVVKGTNEQIHNDIHNISSGPIVVTWQVVYHNTDTSWSKKIGICDNQFCYDKVIGMPGPLKTSASIAAGNKGSFDAQFDATVVPPVGPYYITIEFKNGTETKQGTFELYRWSTGVSTVNKIEDDIVIYPNPAAHELYISLQNNDMNIKTAVLTNTLGQVAGTYPITGVGSRLSLDNLASGTYFVKLLDGQNNVKATRKIVHN